MEYRRFGNCIVVRIDRGEEIVEKVKVVASAENVKLASVSAIGATNEFTIGVFNAQEKKYYANEFRGTFEIVSLLGTISTMDGEVYTHFHMSAGDTKGQVVGGHLNRAVVSATCELEISVIDGEVGRKFDEDVGLNLFEF